MPSLRGAVATTRSADPPAIARLADQIEHKRRDLGVPGMAIAIVKDDRVMFCQGFGRRDLQTDSPVTPDTLFAIGSTTKAFTAMAAMIAVDSGKLSLDDSPRKHLPWFKLQDPDADAKITLRDLLCHRSGLMRTDLLWMPGILSRHEAIRAMASVRPTAKLGQQWQYQNVMFSAAGECVAAAETTTWEEDIQRKILDPLGMKRTVFTIEAMQKSGNFAHGYNHATTGPAVRAAMRDLSSIAPAGAINSSARDLAQWARLMLGRGQIDGRRFVSAKSFDQLVAKQMALSGVMHYGLGWMVWKWRGREAWEHGGGIDGFGALVSLLPSERLGVVILHTGIGSPVAAQVREMIWTALVEQPRPATAAAATTPSTTTPSVRPQEEAGVYRLGGMRVDVAWRDGRLIFAVSGQPDYPLQHQGGRRYKLGPPCPDGFFVTFRPAKDDPLSVEAFLQQPHGDFVLVRKPPATTTAPAYNGPLAELIGDYTDPAIGTLRIALERGKVCLIAPGQPPYPLTEKGKDIYSLGGLPATYGLQIRRDAANKVNGITVIQPGFKLELARARDASIPIDELMAKVVTALGGEANLRRHKSLTLTVTLDLPNQGMTGHGTIRTAAPCEVMQHLTLRAMDRDLVETTMRFDGATSTERVSFMPATPTTLPAEQLDTCRRLFDFYAVLNWKKLYATSTVREQKLAGEAVWAVTRTPARGPGVTDYYSQKTFLPVRRDYQLPTGPMSEAITETYGDYKTIDGVQVPMITTLNRPSLGQVIIKVSEARFD